MRKTQRPKPDTQSDPVKSEAARPVDDRELGQVSGGNGGTAGTNPLYKV